MSIFFSDKNTKLVWSYRCLCYSLCWQDPQATAKQCWGRRSRCLFSSPSWTEPLLGRASLSSFSRCVSMGSVWEEMDFLHVLSEYLHQRKLILPLGEGGQWCLLMLPLRQSPMTNSPQTEEVTDAVKLSGWIWELVSPNCHQRWQGPRHTDTVSTPAATKLSMPSQTLPVISANISSELLPAILSLHWNLV